MWLLGAVALPDIGPAGQQGENSNTSLKCISQAHVFTLSMALGELLSVSSSHPRNSWAAGLHQLWHSLFQLSQHQGTAWAQESTASREESIPNHSLWITARTGRKRCTRTACTEQTQGHLHPCAKRSHS